MTIALGDLALFLFYKGKKLWRFTTLSKFGKSEWGKYLTQISFLGTFFRWQETPICIDHLKLTMLMEVLMTDPILRRMTKPHFRLFPWFQLCFHVVARNLHIIHPLSATWYPGKSAAGVNFTLNGCRPGMSKRWNLGESGCLEFPDHTCMNMWW